MARTKLLVTPPPDYKALANEFAYLRAQAGLTQREVAKQAGLSASQYNRLESAKLIDRPSFDDIMKVCRFFNIDPTKAARLSGLWPVRDTKEVEDDPRWQAIAALIGRMNEPYRTTFIDMMYRAAGANLATGAIDANGLATS